MSLWVSLVSLTFLTLNLYLLSPTLYSNPLKFSLNISSVLLKNIDMSPRQSHGEINAGGMKVKVLGDNSTDFKFKIKNKNK